HTARSISVYAACTAATFTVVIAAPSSFEEQVLAEPIPDAVLDPGVAVLVAAGGDELVEGVVRSGQQWLTAVRLGVVGESSRKSRVLIDEVDDGFHELRRLADFLIGAGELIEGVGVPAVGVDVVYLGLVV